MEEQMNMQTVVEVLTHRIKPRMEGYYYSQKLVEDIIAFLENEMKLPTRDEISLKLDETTTLSNYEIEYERGAAHYARSLYTFINTPKE